MNVTFLLEFQQRNIDSLKLLHDYILMVSHLKMIGWLSFHPQTLAEMVFCSRPDVKQICSRRPFQAASGPNGLAACDAYLHTQSAVQKFALRRVALLFCVASIGVWSCILSCFVHLLVSLEFRTPFAVWSLPSEISPFQFSQGTLWNIFCWEVVENRKEKRLLILLPDLTSVPMWSKPQGKWLPLALAQRPFSWCWVHWMKRTSSRVRSDRRLSQRTFWERERGISPRPKPYFNFEIKKLT